MPAAGVEPNVLLHVFVCIDARICMYWYVFGMFWYVLQIGSTHGFGARYGGIGTYRVCICPYFGMFLLVLCDLFYELHVFVRIDVFKTVKPSTYKNMYWYILVHIEYVLVCI
jgi:hypothetical protein